MDKAFQKKLEELAYGRPLYVVVGDSLIEPAERVSASCSKGSVVYAALLSLHLAGKKIGSILAENLKKPRGNGNA